MIEILKESIDLSKAENFRIEDLEVETKKASINRESRVLTLYLVLNFVLSAETAERFKTKLRRLLKDVRDIDLILEYSDIKGREIPVVERKTEAERPAGQKNGNSGGWQRG